jgi:hypothetical protein
MRLTGPLGGMSGVAEGAPGRDSSAELPHTVAAGPAVSQ